MRIVSLVPSVTETLVHWGVEPVGVTRFCEHPELTAVGGTKDPDVAAIVALAPDLVVLCEEENRREDAEALGAAGLATCTLVVESVADAVFAVGALGAFVGRTDRLDAFHAALTADPTTATTTTAVRAFVPIWRRPWRSLSAATYGSSLLAGLGIANVCAVAAERYPTVTLEEIAAAAPDVVLAPSEPYPFGARHVAELAEVAPVELVDGQDLFWWGIRTPEARARLRERLADWLS